MNIRTSLLALLLCLSGCATCREHPTMCAVGGAIIAGSITATLMAHDRNHPPEPRHIESQSPCAPQGLTVCN